MLIAIWAQDKNGLIGKNDHLPWRLPNDLRFFKEKTVNNTIVMGRKTFEGMGSRPLPNRQTIVLTHNTAYENNQVLVMHSLEEVLHYSQQTEMITYIAGGSAVYQDFLPQCDFLYRTTIDHAFEGDAYFPSIDWNNWQLIKQTQGTVDEKNPYPHVFEVYKNNKDRT
ncbi:dihydrofolate reductase [Candidatus Enterococcus ferrettii]|uniref:Dihydrofolate reductase n=1 Tax=Candidatus Enterococcus ferrettii TaxID=2815324 RepID=A0ABV0ENU0_9ENTE|nr:dihydrofolate reductase [Enterococcus sp. 665A]MBO1342869.1 dihydrofolate reductase [Enterococcus sp. 665A]